MIIFLSLLDILNLVKVVSIFNFERFFAFDRTQMIDHNRVFNLHFEMKKNNDTFFTYNFWSFFYDSCIFEKLLSMKRLFFEILTYFFFHSFGFFLVVVKSFARHSSIEKIVFFCYLENETFYKFIECLKFYRRRYFHFR
jgi:hypothetical protein